MAQMLDGRGAFVLGRGVGYGHVFFAEGDAVLVWWLRLVGSWIVCPLARGIHLFFRRLLCRHYGRRVFAWCHREFIL